jgi:hypothetical protein
MRVARDLCSVCVIYIYKRINGIDYCKRFVYVSVSRIAFRFDNVWKD